MDSIEVAAEHQVEFQAVYGICAQAIRYAGAYVVLHRAGRSREAVAVARQALEHALTAQWAHFDPTGPEQLIDGYHHSHQRVFSAVTEHLGIPAEGIAETLKSTRTKGKQLVSVKGRMQKVDFENMFETAYMRQSQIVHVTSETVTAFLDLDPQKRFIIRSDPSDPNERQTAHLTAMATMFASWVLESLRIGQPGISALDGISDALRLPLNIRD